MMLAVNNIRNILIKKYKEEDYVIDKTGSKLIEIVGASFIADEQVIFGTLNTDYIEREIEWYRSESLFVDDIPGSTPKIWKDVSCSKGTVNSNYGWCIFNAENHSQYQKVKETLDSDTSSRRASMIYTRPSMHVDYNKDGMSDFICTYGVDYLIRNNKLNCVVHMRSNDVVFGYKNDHAWQKYVLEMLANDLGIETGDIHWNVSSLHLYERHFGLLDVK